MATTLCSSPIVRSMTARYGTRWKSAGSSSSPRCDRHLLPFEGLEVRQDGLDAIADLTAFAAEVLQLLDLRLQLIALTAQLLDDLHSALDALGEKSEDATLFRSGDRHLFFGSLLFHDSPWGQIYTSIVRSTTSSAN